MTQIKPQDLRIGNYVQFKQNPYHQIRFGSELDRNVFEPIPLSEEILLKCGFEKVEHCFLFKGFCIEPKPKRGCFFFYFRDKLIRQVNVLHDLQNIVFSLVGEELTITL